MLRQGGLLGGKSLLQRPPLCAAGIPRAASSSSKASQQDGEGEKSTTRRWLEAFDKNPDIVPSSISRSKAQKSSSIELGYGKSPQTKATLDMPITALANHITPGMVEQLKKSSHYVQKSDLVSITSDQRLKQKENMQNCLKKLKQLLRDVAKDTVAKEFDPDRLPIYRPKIPAKAAASGEAAKLKRGQSFILKNKREAEYRKLKHEQARAEVLRLEAEVKESQRALARSRSGR